MKLITDNEFADALESRNALCRLDQLERRSRALLADPQYRPYRCQQVRFEIREIEPAEVAA